MDSCVAKNPMPELAAQGSIQNAGLFCRTKEVRFQCPCPAEQKNSMLILIAMVVFLVLITVGTDVIEGAPEMAGQSLGDYMRPNSKVTMDMYVEVKYNSM